MTGTYTCVYDAWNRLVEALGEFYPDAQLQRCVVHFYRNVFTAVPKGKAREKGVPVTEFR
jgi:putative transposase